MFPIEFRTWRALLIHLHASPLDRARTLSFVKFSSQLDSGNARLPSLLCVLHGAYENFGSSFSDVSVPDAREFLNRPARRIDSPEPIANEAEHDEKCVYEIFFSQAKQVLSLTV